MVNLYLWQDGHMTGEYLAINITTQKFNWSGTPVEQSLADGDTFFFATYNSLIPDQYLFYSGYFNLTTPSASSTSSSALSTSASSTSSSALSTSASSTSPSALSTSASSTSSSALSTGAKAGIGVGVGLGFLVLVAGIGFFVLRSRKGKRKPEGSNVYEIQPAEKDMAAEMNQEITVRPEMDGHATSGVSQKWLTGTHELEGTIIGPDLDGARYTGPELDDRSGSRTEVGS